jgi:hypothetical protein
MQIFELDDADQRIPHYQWKYPDPGAGVDGSIGLRSYIPYTFCLGFSGRLDGAKSTKEIENRVSLEFLLTWQVLTKTAPFSPYFKICDRYLRLAPTGTTALSQLQKKSAASFDPYSRDIVSIGAFPPHPDRR